jgi:hypothetical protein
VSEPSSGITRYSAWAPNSPCAPNPALNPKTRSPACKDVTSPPSASTSPANSFPKILALGLTSPLKSLATKGLADRKPQSVRLTVVA